MSFVELRGLGRNTLYVRPESVSVVADNSITLTSGLLIRLDEKPEDIVKKLGVGGEGSSNLKFFTMILELALLTNAPDGLSAEALTEHAKKVIERLVFLADLFVDCANEEGVDISDDVEQAIKEHLEWKGEGDGKDCATRGFGPPSGEDSEDG